MTSAPLVLQQQQLLQQQQQLLQQQPQSPELSNIPAATPEKLDVSVDLSSFYGLQEKMSGLQDKFNFSDGGNGVGGGVEDWSNFNEILEMQRKRLVKAKRHRSENVSERDKMLFLNILGPKVDVIENRRVGGTSKMQMWREIEAQFNASAEVERSYDQLRELWKRLKIAMKKELEVGRQKGFAPLPASITRTFSLLKDYEFVDDVNNGGGLPPVLGSALSEDDAGQHFGGPAMSQSEHQQPSSPHNSPYKPSLDSSTASDSSDAALLNAFQLTSLFAQREDGKSLAERLSQAEISLTHAKKTDTMAIMEKLSLDKREEAKGLAERLAQSELGQDLTITQINNSNALGRNLASLNNGALCDPEDSPNSKDCILKVQQLQNSDSDNSDHADTDNLSCVNTSEQEISIKPEFVSAITSSSCNNNSSNVSFVHSSSPVPDLVKLHKSLCLAGVPSRNSSSARLWEGTDAARRGLKRRLDVPIGCGDGSATVGISGNSGVSSNPGVSGSSRISGSPGILTGVEEDCMNRSVNSDWRYSQQRLRNEEDKGKLIQMQLQNESLKNELLSILVCKLKHREEDAALQAFKAVVS